MCLLSFVGLVEGALESARAQIDLAHAAGRSSTQYDVLGLPVQAIDAVRRALTDRGYRVLRSTSSATGRIHPVLRIAWDRPEPQLRLWE